MWAYEEFIGLSVNMPQVRPHPIENFENKSRKKSSIQHYGCCKTLSQILKKKKTLPQLTIVTVNVIREINRFCPI